MDASLIAPVLEGRKWAQRKAGDTPIRKQGWKRLTRAWHLFFKGAQQEGKPRPGDRICGKICLFLQQDMLVPGSHVREEKISRLGEDVEKLKPFQQGWWECETAATVTKNLASSQEAKHRITIIPAIPPLGMY